MRRGFVCSADGRIVVSWRWAEEGPSRQGFPVPGPGGFVVELPEDADDGLAYAIHQTVGKGWTWDEVRGVLGSGTVAPLPADLAAPPEGRQHHVLVGALAIVEVDAPRRRRLAPDKDALLGRQRRQRAAKQAPEREPVLIAILPGSPLFAAESVTMEAYTTAYTYREEKGVRTS